MIITQTCPYCHSSCTVESVFPGVAQRSANNWRVGHPCFPDRFALGPPVVETDENLDDKEDELSDEEKEAAFDDYYNHLNQPPKEKPADVLLFPTTGKKR